MRDTVSVPGGTADGPGPPSTLDPQFSNTRYTAPCTANTSAPPVMKAVPVGAVSTRSVLRPVAASKV